MERANHKNKNNNKMSLDPLGLLAARDEFIRKEKMRADKITADRLHAADTEHAKFKAASDARRTAMGDASRLEMIRVVDGLLLEKVRQFNKHESYASVGSITFWFYSMRERGGLCVDDIDWFPEFVERVETMGGLRVRNKDVLMRSYFLPSFPREMFGIEIVADYPQ